jgi:steroid delta-isomerase-like uncharacterized protein
MKTQIPSSEESMHLSLEQMNHDYCYYLESELVYIINLSRYKYPQEDFMKVFRIIFFFTVLAFSLSIPSNAKDVKKVGETNKAKVRQAYDAINAGDWDKFATLLSDDFVDHNPNPGQKPGAKGAIESLSQFREVFPDLKFNIKHIVLEGDMAAVHFLMTGTNKGEFMGKPATGKTFTIESYELLRIVKGKAVERWGISDNASMMMQLWPDAGK